MEEKALFRSFSLDSGLGRPANPPKSAAEVSKWGHWDLLIWATPALSSIPMGMVVLGHGEIKENRRLGFGTPGRASTG
jgi:hypothetical protein